MTYIIDARLECGAPSLTLIDAVTGEARLHWRCESVVDGERAWQNLFKQLVLLSCADRINLVQRAQSPLFGDECVGCTVCVDQGVSPGSSLNSYKMGYDRPFTTPFALSLSKGSGCVTGGSTGSPRTVK